MATLALMYHAVQPLQRKWDLIERALVVDPEVFTRQMEALAGMGYRTLTLAEYGAALAAKTGERALLLTFDDAYEGLDERVTPVLLRLGFTAVVFAPMGQLGRANGWDRGHPVLSSLRVMSASDLERLASGPWEVASHGLQHVDLRRLEPRERRRQLVTSRQQLSRLTGRTVTALAYPFGLEDAQVRSDAKLAGYELAFAASPYTKGRMSLPRRAVTDLDRGTLLRLRTARHAYLYRLEDLARGPARLRRLPSWWRAHRAREGDR